MAEAARVAAHVRSYARANLIEKLTRAQGWVAAAGEQHKTKGDTQNEPTPTEISQKHLLSLSFIGIISEDNSLACRRREGTNIPDNFPC